MHFLVIGIVKPAHQAIVDLGHKVTLFKDLAAAKAGDLEFPYTKLFLFEKDSPEEECINIAKAVHQTNPFDAVCSFNDVTQEVAIKIAQELGLPFPVDLDTLKIVYNKQLTREALNEANLDDTLFHLVDNEPQLRDIIASANCTLILKPTDSTGSSGISVIESEADIEPALACLKASKCDFPVIVEGFLEGKEYSVEAISEDGEHFVFGITEKMKDPKTFLELGHVFPAPLEDKVEQEIKTFVQKTLSALNINNGASHTEVIYTPNGPRIVETHTRAGGDKIFQLVEYTTGAKLFELIARQALGEKVMPELKGVKPTKVAAIKFLALGYDDKTKLIEFENIKEAKQIEGVQEIFQYKAVGDTMNAINNSFGRTASIAVCAENKEAALAICDEAINTLSLKLSWNK